MTEKNAMIYAKAFRHTGYDVKPHLSQMGWELLGKAANGGRDFFGLSFNSMKYLVTAGRIATIVKAK